jgi:hypothetical protein
MLRFKVIVYFVDFGGIVDQHASRGRHKVFNKVGLFKANTVSSVYMRITTFS